MTPKYFESQIREKLPRESLNDICHTKIISCWNRLGETHPRDSAEKSIWSLAIEGGLSRMCHSLLSPIWDQSLYDSVTIAKDLCHFYVKILIQKLSIKPLTFNEIRIDWYLLYDKIGPGTSICGWKNSVWAWATLLLGWLMAQRLVWRTRHVTGPLKCRTWSEIRNLII